MELTVQKRKTSEQEKTELMLKIIGVSSGECGNYFLAAYFICSYPVAFYMTLCITFKVTVEFVLSAPGWQRFLKNKRCDKIIDFTQIFTALFKLFKVFLNWLVKTKSNTG